MHTQPAGADLLETARTILRKELLPALPPAQRHLALMVANAMGIAARQLEAGETAQRRELEQLAQLLALAPPDTGASLESEQDRLGDALHAAIRAGHADPGAPLHDALGAFLRATCRRRVQESNPKYLGAPT